MRYALDHNKKKIKVKLSAERAVCPGCQKEVIGKIYESRSNHWAHLKRDCDDWYEPITDWHINWQNFFPEENQEVTLFDEKNEEFHRADIVLNNGVVIEIQNSPIHTKGISAREKFYGKKGLIWVLNAKNLIPKTRLVNFFKPERCSIYITFQKGNYFEFVTKKIIGDLKDNFRHSFEEGHHKSESKDSIYYILFSTSIVNMEFEKELIESTIESLNWKYSRSNHGSEEKFYTVEIENLIGKFTFHKFLGVHQWRKFIDKMDSPVFLDQLTDLHHDYLFWVQKGKIVKKEDFIKKYLQYTDVSVVTAENTKTKE